MPYWTVDEATALSFGKEPAIINWDYLKNYHDHPLARDYAKRRELFSRAEARGKLQEKEPAAFVAWANDVGIPFCPELAEMVRTKKQTPAVESDKPLHAKERNTLLTILRAVAVEKYRFDSAAARQHAFVAIADTCRKHGTPIDADTVRKWLFIAAEEVTETAQRLQEDEFGLASPNSS